MKIHSPYRGDYTIELYRYVTCRIPTRMINIMILIHGYSGFPPVRVGGGWPSSGNIYENLPTYFHRPLHTPYAYVCFPYVTIIQYVWRFRFAARCLPARRGIEPPTRLLYVSYTNLTYCTSIYIRYSYSYCVPVLRISVYS